MTQCVFCQIQLQIEHPTQKNITVGEISKTMIHSALLRTWHEVKICPLFGLILTEGKTVKHFFPLPLCHHPSPVLTYITELNVI